MAMRTKRRHHAADDGGYCCVIVSLGFAVYSFSFKFRCHSSVDSNNITHRGIFFSGLIFWLEATRLEKEELLDKE